MPSRNDPDLIDFQRGVVTTPDDIEALERVRRLNRLDSAAYLDFLMAFTSSHPPSRDIPSCHEPFRL